MKKLLLFLFFLLQTLNHPLQAMDSINKKQDTILFLETLASAEPENWNETLSYLSAHFPNWMKEKAPRYKLNELSTYILEQDDLNLIFLYQRALRNHDELSAEKAKPFTFYYKNYQPPAFQIPEIDLTLDIQDNKAFITSGLLVRRNTKDESLILNGIDHKVHTVSLNGKKLGRDKYRVTKNELILLSVPQEEQFTVTIESEIDPFQNGSMEGLYVSGKFLTSHCESEGARRIFYTLDRPDVLSCITTTIIADQNKYPYRLSNGNLLTEMKMEDGRAKIVWEDPIPKPSYLFAVVLGDFGRLEDHFTTRSGREVTLEVYVEKGKEARAEYSLLALKESMKFDEEFFDREYDLDSLKMVGVPDFNAGAMENKGLMIFNTITLLTDQYSGTDAAFRRVASVVAHEYFHNWSGNRVTVRNWFEIALKEAFTDFRAMLFGEWLFGSEFIRPKDVTILREGQFPEETSGKGHPIMVESYVSANSIYDATTYVKGREVFRTLQNYMDMMVPGSFRETQNIYFERYDGQAVTFRELLSVANEVLEKNTGKNLSQFERWFDQQGTPHVHAETISRGNKAQLIVTQCCPHPRTGDAQQPFLIPFSYEFLRKDGTVVQAKKNFVLSEKTHVFEIPAQEGLVPIFMHGYSAPVVVEYDYSLEDLACLMNHAEDPFTQWEAGQNYALLVLEETLSMLDHKKEDYAELMQPYQEALENPHLSPLAKAQLLQIPSLRSISQKLKSYDFVKLREAREVFKKQLASNCRPVLEKQLLEHPEPAQYAPTSQQMHVRELRNACWNLLAQTDRSYVQRVSENYFATENFNNSMASLNILSNLTDPLKEKVITDFYEQWKGDKTVFTYWLQAQAGSSCCRVKDLKKLMQVKGFDKRNPNHIRSVLRTFLQNLGQYHDSKGEGYAFLVDQIIEVGKTNPQLAHNNLAVVAFMDFNKVPRMQQKLMVEEIKRLQDPAVSPETRAFVNDLLERAIP